MTETRACRICGSVWPYPSHYWITEGGGCKTCGGSPLCDGCGHPRSSHRAVFKKGRRSCGFLAYDRQSLSHIPCNCAGYVPIEGAIAGATFAQPETGPLPRLREPGTRTARV